jgi:hypothetical protein
MPPVAVCCYALGVLSIIFSALMIAFAISNAAHPAPDTLSFVLTAAAIGFGSIVWFVVGRAITLLAQIAHNTRRGEE